MLMLMYYIVLCFLFTGFYFSKDLIYYLVALQQATMTCNCNILRYMQSGIENIYVKYTGNTDTIPRFDNLTKFCHIQTLDLLLDRRGEHLI